MIRKYAPFALLFLSFVLTAFFLFEWIYLDDGDFPLAGIITNLLVMISMSVVIIQRWKYPNV